MKWEEAPRLSYLPEYLFINGTCRFNVNEAEAFDGKIKLKNGKEIPARQMRLIGSVTDIPCEWALTLQNPSYKFLVNAVNTRNLELPLTLLVELEPKTKNRKVVGIDK